MASQPQFSARSHAVPAEHVASMDVVEDDAPPAEFLWQPCNICLIGADGHGRPVDRASLPTSEGSNLRVHVEMSSPLLYWAKRKQWLWHKKWSLPTITVRVNRKDSTATNDPAGASERLIAVVSAGTLHGDELSEACTLQDAQIEDVGLAGTAQLPLELASHSGALEATFSRLLFQQTSFHCARRPFHLVITILKAPPQTNEPEVAAPAAAPEGAMAISDASEMPLKPLCCLCSSPVLVDARKRSRTERPTAAGNDVRLINRQHGRFQ